MIWRCPRCGKQKCRARAASLKRASMSHQCSLRGDMLGIRMWGIQALVERRLVRLG